MTIFLVTVEERRDTGTICKSCDWSFQHKRALLIYYEMKTSYPLPPRISDEKYASRKNNNKVS